MTNKSDSTPTQFAAEFSAGLRALAAILDEHPELAKDMGSSSLNSFLKYNFKANQAERLALWVRAARKSGATVKEESKGDDFKVHLTFGSLRVSVWADQEKVCERIVVGTETVDKVEWRCPALLSAESAESREPVTAGSVATS